MTSPSQPSQETVHLKTPVLSARKNLAVAVLFAVMLAVAVFAGSRTVPTSNAANQSASANAPSAVVAVDASDPSAAAAAWRRTPSASLPGTVLVIPATGDPACPERIADSAARTEEAIGEAAMCSADRATRDAARSSTLLKAAEQARTSRASLVLVGDGWTSALPLSVSNPADQSQISTAVLAAAANGALPNLRDLSVTVIAPVPAADAKSVWDAYFTAAGARRVEWLGGA